MLKWPSPWATAPGCFLSSSSLIPPNTGIGMIPSKSHPAVVNYHTTAAASLLPALALALALLSFLPKLGVAARVMPILFLLLADLLQLLLLRQLLLGSEDASGTYPGNGRFRLTWRHLLLLHGATLTFSLLPTPLPVPTPSMFTAVLAAATTSAATIAAVARSATAPLIFLLFPPLLILLVRCAVRGPERLRDGQEPSSFNGRGWRPLFLAVSFILSCSMLQGTLPMLTPFPVPAAIWGIATTITVVVSVFLSFSLALSSSPPPLPPPADLTEAEAAAGLLMDKVV